MLDELKERVLKLNKAIRANALAVLTWGNVSGRDRETGLMVIKPSGFAYDRMNARDMVVVDMDGRVVEGECRPSVDSAVHIVLYRAFGQVGGIMHTHSPFATAWAQAQKSIPAGGTTHFDFFCGDVPCTRPLTGDEIAGEYEKNIGHSIVEALAGRNPLEIPAALAAGHGPFVWGRTPEEALENGIALEEIAKIAAIQGCLPDGKQETDRALMEKHYSRKHSYYGQEKARR